MAAKYKEYYKEMITAHRELFEKFKDIHDQYVMDEDAWKKEFNEVGAKTVEIIREYEVRLCSHSEGGQYGKFATNLADKFWNEVRKEYPRVDFVGVK